MKTVIPVVALLLLGAGVLFGMSRHHATAGHHMGGAETHCAMTAHGADGIHENHAMSERADACPGCGGGERDETPEHGKEKEGKDDDTDLCH